MKKINLRKSLGLMIAAVMIMCCMVPATALAANYGHTVSGDTVFDNSTDKGDLAADGYSWDSAKGELILDSVEFKGSVTLPNNNPVDVIVRGSSSCDILTLNADGKTQHDPHLTISGAGVLNINNFINSSEKTKITIAKGAHVTLGTGEDYQEISIGGSGNSDSELNVNGTLEINTGLCSGTVRCEKMNIGSTGNVKIAGVSGVKVLNEFNLAKGGVYTFEFKKALKDEEPGSCDFAIMAENGSPDSLNIPDSYMPEGFEKKVVSDDNGKEMVTIVPVGREVTGDAEMLFNAGCDLTLQYYAPETPVDPETKPEGGDEVVPDNGGDAVPEAQEEITESPQTDDPSNVLPLIGLLVAAGLGIVAIVVHAIRSANKDN